MLRSFLSVIVAAALLVFLGRSQERGGIRAAGAVAAATGFALLVPLLALCGVAGLPIRAWTIVAIALGTAVFLRTRLARAPSSEAAALSPAPLPGLSVTALVPAMAFGAFAWKISRVPVWCWDHYAVWGMKSRRMIWAGLLDLDFLQIVPFSRMNAEYPVGLPLGWRVLTLGRPLTELDVKLCHVLFAAAVVLLVRRSLLERGVEVWWADGLAALAAISPLFWDTESLGIAEMPLAAAALAGACLALRPDGFRGRGAFTTGLVLGSLPWIKKEGLSLSLLLLAVGLLSRESPRERRWRGILLAPSVWAALAGGALLFEWTVLRPSPGFFAGSWLDRVESRLPHAWVVISAAARELLAPDWYGFWLLFPLGVLLAIVRRRLAALALSGAVLIQAAIYVSVYFGTYLEPVAHVHSSFFRLMAALLPLAALAVGLAFAPRETPAEPSARGESMAGARRGIARPAS